jgi:hypothetical protein
MSRGAAAAPLEAEEAEFETSKGVKVSLIHQRPCPASPTALLGGVRWDPRSGSCLHLGESCEKNRANFFECVPALGGLCARLKFLCIVSILPAAIREQKE